MILSVITSPDTYLLESIDPEPGLFWTSEIYGPKYSGYLARVFGNIGFFFKLLNCTGWFLPIPMCTLITH